MISKTTNRFWKCYNALPDAIKRQAKESYKLFVTNPYHPGLRFKRIHSHRPIFSIRITMNYRALGILQGNDIIWFWIGSHLEYEKLLKRLNKSEV